MLCVCGQYTYTINLILIVSLNAVITLTDLKDKYFSIVYSALPVDCYMIALHGLCLPMQVLYVEPPTELVPRP